MLSSKSAQFLEFMELRTRTTIYILQYMYLHTESPTLHDAFLRSNSIEQPYSQPKTQVKQVAESKKINTYQIAKPDEFLFIIKF